MLTLRMREQEIEVWKWLWNFSPINIYQGVKGFNRVAYGCEKPPSYVESKTCSSAEEKGTTIKAKKAIASNLV